MRDQSEKWPYGKYLQCPEAWQGISKSTEMPCNIEQFKYANCYKYFIFFFKLAKPPNQNNYKSDRAALFM